MRTVYLGLGTNLDNRDEWLDRGLQLLEEALVERRSIECMTLSARYETEAWGMAEDTPAFMNMVVAIDTALPLPDLLRLSLDIEQACGRIRNPDAQGYLNRTLDVDVLCTSDAERWSATADLDLDVPHPRMMSRRFVLQPLVDIAPELQVEGCSIQAALDQCPIAPAVVLRDSVSHEQPKTDVRELGH